jgi:hypothetical protein
MAPSSHPHPNELLSCHFGETSEAQRGRILEHLRDCADCAAEMDLYQVTAGALADWPEEEPPAGGLERIVALIGDLPPTRTPHREWLRSVLASLAGVTVGGLAIYRVGLQLVALPVVEKLPVLEPLKAVSGFGLAALAFFAVGSLVTLALAPVLIIESELRERPWAIR